MTYDLSKLPAVREHLAQDVEALKGRHAQRAQALAKASVSQYARAPSASGAPQADVRPPSTQGQKE
jgi:hypothetical protein